MYRLLIAICFVALTTTHGAELDLTYFDSNCPELVGDHVYYFEDVNHQLGWNDLASVDFQKLESNVAIFPNSNSTYWCKMELKAPDELSGEYVLDIKNPLLDSLDLYIVQNGKLIRSFHSGDRLKFNSRPLRFNSFAFPLYAEESGAFTAYLRVRSADQMLVPIFIGNREGTSELKNYQDLIFGMYVGLMLVMFLYNAFIWISTKDKSYLFYIIYVAALVLTQMILEGMAFHRLFPSSPGMHNFGVVLFSALTGFGAIEFARSFLNMKETAPRFNKGLYLFEGLYLFAVIFRATGMDILSFRILDLAGMMSTLYGLTFASWLVYKGYREAKFYLAGWIFFIIGIIVFVLKNFGILPFNSLTSSAIQMGSAAEIVLLSFALADRINRLRKEREEAQAESLKLSLENERIIREQNIVLEQKVEERTLELQEANEELKVTLDHLKDTQAQLVDAEKMASLGQLTAGIAHEINNPINFVSSNIQPLKRDIEDLIDLIEHYQHLESDELDDSSRISRIKEILEFKEEIDLDFLKDEIDELIVGIKDGAERTAEIVSGLRTFSRVDEEDFKIADIEAGLDSTIALLNSKFRGDIDVTREYTGLSHIYCNAGKLNQVFMNIMTNGIYAIEKQMATHPELKGNLTIRTGKVNESIWIEIEDNGIGMSEDVKRKVFEPFFTTKDVGEGTGLGMSIVYNILQEHHADVKIDSQVGKGSKFRITLPEHQAASNS